MQTNLQWKKENQWLFEDRMMGDGVGKKMWEGLWTHKKTLGDDEYAYTDYRDVLWEYINIHIYNMSKLSKVLWGVKCGE